MEAQSPNLIEGILFQIDRVNGIIQIYEELPGGAGNFAIAMMKASIQKARQSLSGGDVVEMLRAFKDLEDFEI